MHTIDTCLIEFDASNATQVWDVVSIEALETLGTTLAIINIIIILCLCLISFVYEF